MDRISAVKHRLFELIDMMEKSAELFVKDASKDFSRTRKLSFGQTVRFLLAMGGGSLGNELMRHYACAPTMPTVSAFTQRRDKIKAAALEFLWRRFTDSFPSPKTFQVYRLLAVDGSDINIPHDPLDSQTYFQSQPNTQGFNLLHLNALYDVCNQVYLDAVIQKRRMENEARALVQMVDRLHLDRPAIIVADRGYESYNVMAHIDLKGWYYVIRVKDRRGRCILSPLNLPDTDEFDVPVDLILTSRQTAAIKQLPQRYRFVPSTSTFDFIDNKLHTDFPVSFRALRFEIAPGLFETLVTNLPTDRFPSKTVQEIYRLRWGVETSFRHLKHTIGLSGFHSKKAENILQEIFARLTMFNFCSILADRIPIPRHARKYDYRLNFSAVTVVAAAILSRGSLSPPAVEALMRKFLLPVRPGRACPRKARPARRHCFNYR